MSRKSSLAVALVFIMIFSLTACGGSKDKGADESTAVSSTVQQEVIEELAEEAAEVPMPEAETAASTDAAADTATEANGTEASSAEKLLGDWTDINDVNRFVKITSNGDQYEYEDVDGKYPGTIVDGVLIIKISDSENDTASVFIDAKTGNMVTNYQGDIYEFNRKLN